MKLRQILHIFLRHFKDMSQGDTFAKKGAQLPMLYSISLSQPYTPSTSLESKRQNLRIAAKNIAQYTIAPGEVFSFWRAVGNPSSKKFRPSESIATGDTKLQLGGGLCQASSIIYQLALKAGLNILERHSHPSDIFTDETRVSPLGSDAIVSYGLRDLRLRNNTNCNIRFELVVEDNQLVGHLFSFEKIEEHNITFTPTTLSSGKVQVITCDNRRPIVTTTYTPSPTK